MQTCPEGQKSCWWAQTVAQLNQNHRGGLQGTVSRSWSIEQKRGWRGGGSASEPRKPLQHQEVWRWAQNTLGPCTWLEPLHCLSQAISCLPCDREVLWVIKLQHLWLKCFAIQINFASMLLFALQPQQLLREPQIYLLTRCMYQKAEIVDRKFCSTKIYTSVTQKKQAQGFKVGKVT